MRLDQFILTHRAPILSEWDAYTHQHVPAMRAPVFDALRIHANEMLMVIAGNIGCSNLETDGSAFDAADARDYTGKQARAEAGFTAEQMATEYDGLRASVIRVWSHERPNYGITDCTDLDLFNAAIDEAQVSIADYDRNTAHCQAQFLAVLQRELRQPSWTAVLPPAFALERGELAQPVAIERRVTLSPRWVLAAAGVGVWLTLGFADYLRVAQNWERALLTTTIGICVALFVVDFVLQRYVDWRAHPYRHLRHSV